MPQQVAIAVENNFTKGLITESTGLNFPENAATDTDNCEYTLVGNVLRRQGIDYEENYALNSLSRSNVAISTYKWNNAGGDGNTQVIVTQTGRYLRFWSVTDSTEASPLSQHLLDSSINISDYTAVGASYDNSQEATYADGNGFLFIFHPNCDPFFCTYNNGVITGTKINIQIRDLTGIPEIGYAVNYRPGTLTTEHNYNLQNQGWTLGQAWSATSTDGQTAQPTGPRFWNVSAVGTPSPGQVVNVRGTIPGNATDYCELSGTVTSFAAGVLTLNVYSVYTTLLGSQFSSWTFTPTNTGYISTWLAAENSYPSNADVWWRFRNASGVFDPATTQPNITLGVGQAPQGHFLLSAFSQNRSSASGIAGISSVATIWRPSVGTWFQGRIWYSGVNSSTVAVGNAPYYSWSENIYFSQVCIGGNTNFGNCYQVNDPTSADLFDILPTDGGVIQIQGCGKIYKLFPIQNGMLVHAANGIWFITGSQGIGFTANDYTITKISSVETISSTSFVDVLGLPYFWNEEGIYSVQPSQKGGLTVEPITVGTILTFYNNIPKQSKKYVRGVYNPIDYVIQWIYKSEDDTDVSDRYSFDKILNFDTYNKAFFPYTVDTVNSTICGINYIQGPGGLFSPDATFKYFTFKGLGECTFSDEHDEDFVDWASSGTSSNYVSYFITGYKLRGQGIRKFQPQYIQVYSNADGMPSGYKIQGIWNYAISGNSGKYSTIQKVDTDLNTNYKVVFKRHKIRGSGFALQFKVASIDGKNFDIIGWSVVDTVNQGV